MNNYIQFFSGLAVMAGVTYLVRMLPLVLVKKKIENRFINVELSDEEISNRLANRKNPKRDVDGWLSIYSKVVQSADTGAILR